MELYRIKRIKDNKYYKGKSKFTKYGTYFRKEQLKMNIRWVLRSFSDEKLFIEVHEVKEIYSIELRSDDDLDNINKILERDEKIKDLLK